MQANSRHLAAYLPTASTDGARLYLTFDDGPDPRWTPAILDLLAERRLPATFFVVGRAAQQSPQLIRRIVADGHQLGNHTLSHRHPWKMLGGAARREVRDGAAAIADISGQMPLHYRPPHGRLRRCMVDEAARHGQSTVLWSLSAIDWGPLGQAEAIAERLRKARNGDVILMHDGQNRFNRPFETLKVLPDFLDGLARDGLTPSPLPARI